MLKSIIAIFLFSACIQGADFTKESLMTDIDAMSALLADDTKTVELLQTYINPEQIEGILKKEGSLDDIAGAFNKDEKKPVLIELLHKITLESLIADDEKHTIQAKIGNERPLVFSFINGRWYINN